MLPELPAPRATPSMATISNTDAKLWQAAQQLEATFIAEMLKSAGLSAPNDGFGGGIGEEQFSSFLIEEQAKGVVSAGGIGLAEALFEAMKVESYA